MSFQTQGLPVRDIPLKDIRRPILPVLEEGKICKMIDTVENNGELPPIDVLELRENGQSSYFAFGGCHRFQAYERTNTELVKCRVMPATKDMLKMYLGSSI
ncbi:hypothetical protein CANCADRAFT_30594 [Tortispora caseinolytica NRRL Y-17796]|uniref:Sulfiredoxin n=1 Tax=Tortispora caseinolytica NRRL Y-17796 TaxID=767744 RepID=A0A1E4TL25_9ASCO|nr:hypothetical protein CANCADRAFT_30594 [Tortispora caseinolytica NRRL Y-17796]